MDQRFTDYFIGFAQTDGSLYQDKKGYLRLTFEISSKDEEVLLKIKDKLPCTSSYRQRTRNTNFKQNYSSSSLSICNQDFLQEINSLGVPIGKKSSIINMPSSIVHKEDYWRGIIDGDGSIGFRKIATKITPYISLITTSDNLIFNYLRYMKDVFEKQFICNRNKRDNAYNFLVESRRAQQICSLLYYDGCFGMQRKINAAKSVKEWDYSISTLTPTPLTT